MSCKKENKNGIPLVAVDLTLYINNPSYSDLHVSGGWAYITGGVKGIILFRSSVDEFIAYERNCTYQPYNNCSIVDVDSTNIFIVDIDCCNSKFSIIDGVPVNGPASQLLKQYSTSYDGNVLRIYN
jgi:nitrite reductase/ring-hydroxylating ferredoxin subunit